MHIKKDKKIFIAMSGGVDSSVAAAILKAQGYNVIGVTMCFSISYPHSKKPSCCGAEGIADAKKVADKLGLAHYVLDFAQDIDHLIIHDFIEEYVRGRTPNPCVRCNQLIKYGTLYNKVKALGADYLATGHYAQVIEDFHDNQYLLKKAVDLSKDQSYFLYAIKREQLASILFPLGDMTKEQVRTIARENDLFVADKKESQDICFVPDDGYKNFIRARAGDGLFVPGDFIDEKGNVVGQHKGIINYTIGQRDKLGIALGKRVYVNKIDKQTNTVYVGPKEYLYSQGLLAKGLNLLKEKPKEIIEAKVRIRYNAKEVKASIEFLKDDAVKISFHEPQLSVTPGQSVVIYQDDYVLGGGIIEEALKE